VVADRKRPPVTENPVSLTAYWTMAVRYEDAVADSPVAADTFAHRFMDDRAREVADQFRSLARPNATVPVRHRLIDDRLAAELERDPDLRVVVIGCGFDSRAFRLRGGRWLEVDEPVLLAHKESLLPASEAANELERVPIRFGVERLEERLAPFTGEERVVVVLEGILNYLNDAERRDLLSALTRLFRHHAVLCDMLGRRFIALYSRRLVKHLRSLGIEFSSSSETPEALFHEFGYRTASRSSVWASANELGATGAPPAWAVRILPGLRDGYCLWSFEYAGDAHASREANVTRTDVPQQQG
jgi:methyltransferase (TIGR00027 family)